MSHVTTFNVTTFAECYKELEVCDGEKLKFQYLLKTKEVEYDQLNKDYGRCATKMGQMEQQVLLAENEVKKTKTQNEELTRHSKELLNELETCRHELEEALREKVLSEQRTKELIKELKLLKNEKERLDQKLESKNRDLESKNREQIEKMREFDAEREKLTRQSEEALRGKKSSEQQTKELEAKFIEELTLLNDEKERLNQELESKNREHEETLTNFAAQQRQLLERCSGISSQLGGKSREMEKVTKQLQTLKDQCEYQIRRLQRTIKKNKFHKELINCQARRRVCERSLDVDERMRSKCEKGMKDLSAYFIEQLGWRLENDKVDKGWRKYIINLAKLAGEALQSESRRRFEALQRDPSMKEDMYTAEESDD